MVAPDRERDNVDALIEEVRKLALRGLQTQTADAANTNDDRTTPSSSSSSRTPPRDDDADPGGVKESSTQSNTHDSNNINEQQQQNNILSRMKTTWMTMTKELRNTRQKSSSTATTPEKNDDKEEQQELAFKISKDSDTYKNIFSTVQWYRDSFLIGSDFADTRSAQRGKRASEQEQEEEDDKKLHSSSRDDDSNNNNTQYTFGNQIASTSSKSGVVVAPPIIIPNSDPNTAMSHPLLLYYTQTYLQSQPALNLLHPYATWIASHNNGPLYPTAVQSMAHTLIPLGQSSCDGNMRENMIWVLKDEEWKEFAKSITVGYVDVQGNSSGQQQQ